ncbi:YIP1 family protein [Candidatus Poribacteria bacterium]|nr:YIP1 family protein [Candidatus Poribacteria bacterium]
MKASLQNIVDILAEPSAAFARLKSEPKWGLAIVIICLFAVGIAWAMFPFTAQMMAQTMMEAGVPAEQIEISTKIGQISGLIGSLVAPIIWLLAISAILTLAGRLLAIDDAIRFKHIFAAVVHTSLISFLIALANTALLAVFRDVEAIKNVADMKMIPGLHLLLGASENVKLLTFLSYFNPLSLWYLAVLAIGVRIFADTDKTKACIGAIVIWLLGVAVEAIFV